MTTHPRDAEHLTGFDCRRCGHAAVAHYRNPSCRVCMCPRDPLCWCGELTSTHEPRITPPGESLAIEGLTEQEADDFMAALEDARPRDKGRAGSVGGGQAT